VLSAKPLVSVITPCFNAEPYLVETAESIISQTYEAIDYIVVDDGSTDGSRALLDRLSNQWPTRIRTLYLEQNRGGSYARNRGAELARGDFLLFLDADDVLLPDAVGLGVEALSGLPHGIAIGNWHRLVTGEAGTWRPAAREVALPSCDPDEALRAWLDGRTWAPPCAVLWRRCSYDRTAGWDEEISLNDDGDLIMRALALRTPIVQSLGSRSFYRSHSGPWISLSQSFASEEKLRSQLHVIDKMSGILEGQGRLKLFADALGTAYHKAALMAFQAGLKAVGRECLGRGNALSGRKLVSARALGRAMEFALGLELKEKLVNVLFRMGAATTERKRVMGFLEVQTAEADRRDKRARSD
jgi:hypothetical protein